jgi:hypothetical protein
MSSLTRKKQGQNIDVDSCKKYSGWKVFPNSRYKEEESHQKQQLGKPKLLQTIHLNIFTHLYGLHFNAAFSLTG